MPTPMTMEMNITEKSVRCPTVSVTMPMAAASVIARAPSMSSGLPGRRNATVMTTRVTAKASTAAISLSRKAAAISSFDSAGPPVTPAWTPANEGLSRAMAARITTQGEERAPRRAVRRGAGEPARHLIEQGAQEPGVHRQILVAQPQIEQVGHERRRHLRVDALEQPGEARVAGEALNELLMVEDLVPDPPELRRREVEELAPLELLGIDAVGDAVEREPRRPQLLGEPGAVGPRRLEGAGLDDHHDVLELAEVPGILRVAHHVAGALRQERPRGGLEGQRVKRVGQSQGGEEQGQSDGEAGAPAGHPDHAAQHAARPRDRGHPVVTTLRGGIG